MKKFFVICLSLLVLASCRYKSGSGNIISDKRNAGEFNKIKASGGFDVELKNGPSEVTVEADDNLMKYIETDVSGGELRIKLDHINVRNAHLKVYVSAPGITRLETSAAANINAKDLLQSAGSLEFVSSSGSEINATVDAPHINVETSSGSEITIKGKTRDVRAQSSSGSGIHASELMSENANAEASSGSNISVHASLKVVADASSGASIKWKGGATDIKRSVSSGGSVDQD